MSQIRFSRRSVLAIASLGLVAAGSSLVYFSDNVRRKIATVYFGLLTDSGVPWDIRSPQELSLDPTRLREFAGYVGGRGCVVRHGAICFTWGKQWNRFDVASASKPLYAHFVLDAVQSGRIKGLDAHVSDNEPRLNRLNADLGFKDREIRWRDLVFMTSGYGVRERPGQAFDYNNYPIALLVDTLLERVYETPYNSWDDDVLESILTGPLQCQDRPTIEIERGHLSISVRDFARFGQLYLQQGKWNNRQLIDARLVRMAVSSPLPSDFPMSKIEPGEMIPGQRSMHRTTRSPDDHLGSYSFCWWTNSIDRDGLRHWPDAPADTFGAVGAFGQRCCMVMPSLDLVASWNVGRPKNRSMLNEALRRLARSVIEDQPGREE